ncbi:MAG: ACP S-malonyltransferase [Deltaproteobacteria bacterium]|nr:ACP S-malonyltransferase [Deltaproteobacteria bacterium]
MSGQEQKIALVFPGQGSQRPGMGKDFFDGIARSRQSFEEASEALGWDVAALCFGEDERLNLTAFTQPCILATEIAMFRAMEVLYGFAPSCFGGHSLGEFTALVAAGALPFPEALRIVHRRGKLMQEAVPPGEGAMAAVISEDLNLETLRDVLGDLPLDVANINSANQAVISGKASAMIEAEKRLTETLGKEKPLRFVTLNVSAPFHSRFMRAIEEPFAETLASLGPGLDPGRATAVTANFTGGFHTGEKAAVVGSLVSQLSHPVRWTDNMRTLAEAAGSVYEVGPGRPLRDFFKTLGIGCSSITTLQSAERLFGGKDR